MAILHVAITGRDRRHLTELGTKLRVVVVGYREDRHGAVVDAYVPAGKVAWLERVDRETRKMDPRVMQVMASVVAVHEVVLVANSEGHLAADVRPLVRFNVSVIVEQNGRREQGYAGAGGRITLPELVEGDRPLALAREAVRQALVNLDAVPAPAGPMTVVLGPGWPGILLHEAIGHGLSDAGVEHLAWFAGERDDVPQLLRRLDCFALPSQTEGISNTLLEAMACGRSTR